MYLLELHTSDPLPSDYAGHPVDHRSPDVAVVDVDAKLLLNAIDLALRWAAQHGATVSAVTVRGATLETLRRPWRPARPTVSGDGWVDVLHAGQLLGLDRDDRLDLFRRIDEASAAGRLQLGSHPDHQLPVIRIEDAPSHRQGRSSTGTSQ